MIDATFVVRDDDGPKNGRPYWQSVGTDGNLADDWFIWWHKTDGVWNIGKGLPPSDSASDDHWRSGFISRGDGGDDPNCPFDNASYSIWVDGAHRIRGKGFSATHKPHNTCQPLRGHRVDTPDGAFRDIGEAESLQNCARNAYRERKYFTAVMLDEGRCKVYEHLEPSLVEGPESAVACILRPNPLPGTPNPQSDPQTTLLGKAKSIDECAAAARSEKRNALGVAFDTETGKCAAVENFTGPKNRAAGEENSQVGFLMEGMEYSISKSPGDSWLSK